jgi:hypothetical protein
MAVLVTIVRPLTDAASTRIGPGIRRSNLRSKWRIGASSAAPGIDLKPLEAAIKKVDSCFHFFKHFPKTNEIAQRDKLLNN